jgi:hypothetical protein
LIQHFLLNLVLPKLEKENFNFLIYHPNASEELISFNLLFKNSWKKCLDTNFKIEISKPVDCHSSTNDQRQILYYYELPGLLNQSDLNLTVASNSTHQITYGTYYFVHLNVNKTNIRVQELNDNHTTSKFE